MKLSDKINAHTSSSSRPFYTFEFFPPRTDQGFANLSTRISRLASLGVTAVSITWGAGGSTRERSHELAALSQNVHGLDTILHLTCTNMEKGMVDEALRNAKARGIENILALRGDPPRGEEYWIPTDPRFTHAVDLVSYIKSSPEFSHFCVGVAAYPDGHPDHETDEDNELDHLRSKVEAGADFIITQLFYDIDGYLRWFRKVRDKGIKIPIIPGIMPLQSYASFLRLTKLCGTKVPLNLHTALETIRHDDQKVKDFGVSLAIKMIQRLTGEGGIEGIHFCTLNLERSVQRVLEGLGWIGGNRSEIGNKLITETTSLANHADTAQSALWITPSDASHTAKSHFASKAPPDIVEPGAGELNQPTTWDEFPNGRFGDSKSPAFQVGVQDLWNAGGLSISRGAALAQWGHPKSIEDLTEIFVSHLYAKIDTTPFSPSSLSPESLTILTHLERLTRKGWWTVGSQPAVDGSDSSDEVFGWGPRGGYVFQKGFVEFFAEKGVVDMVEKLADAKGGGQVHFFAGNAEGDFRTNMPENGRNAVTWGSFPGQEIVQSTIIESESFLSWKEEAFDTWLQWSLLYPPDSDERRLLEGVRRDRWLVNIVHHDYKNPNKIWTFISDD